jgi:hypothetical protein
MLSVIHAPAHVRVEGKIPEAQQDLPGLQQRANLPAKPITLLCVGVVTHTPAHCVVSPIDFCGSLLPCSKATASLIPLTLVVRHILRPRRRHHAPLDKRWGILLLNTLESDARRIWARYCRALACARLNIGCSVASCGCRMPALLRRSGEPAFGRTITPLLSVKHYYLTRKLLKWTLYLVQPLQPGRNDGNANVPDSLRFGRP